MASYFIVANNHIKVFSVLETLMLLTENAKANSTIIFQDTQKTLALKA